MKSCNFSNLFEPAMNQGYHNLCLIKFEILVLRVEIIIVIFIFLAYLFYRHYSLR